MKPLPDIFNDVKPAPQFDNTNNYRKWVIKKYADIFNDNGQGKAIENMMLIHQILYPQIKRMKFGKQLKIVLKMNHSVVRAQRVQVREILNGAKNSALAFFTKTRKRLK